MEPTIEPKLTVFMDGDVLKAKELNHNFEFLLDKIRELETKIQNLV